MTDKPFRGYCSHCYEIECREGSNYCSTECKNEQAADFRAMAVHYDLRGMKAEAQRCRKMAETIYEQP